MALTIPESPLTVHVLFLKEQVTFFLAPKTAPYDNGNAMQRGLAKPDAWDGFPSARKPPLESCSFPSQYRLNRQRCLVCRPRFLLVASRLIFGRQIEHHFHQSVFQVSFETFSTTSFLDFSPFSFLNISVTLSVSPLM